MVDEQDMDKRAEEYEVIIAQLKKANPEGRVDSVKLCNDTSIHLQEVGFVYLVVVYGVVV